MDIIEGEQKLAIIEEALNNVTKHSGASCAFVSLTKEIDKVVLSVTDNGHGFDTSSLHPDSLGLKIMRERAAAIEARLHINSQPGHGTMVTAEWTEDSGQD